ncbi:DNA-dependent RNA polymerase II second largest subunit domain 6,7,3,2 beta subunit [Frog virus 3]|uniref:DNA-directed RNA polymerase n=1 Tax=Frog virus 3 TaxID=10493 RepID=A0A5B8P302_FRG3V|nr:DNA-dependent RNA polymerase II second largest subunit domain 6,7,3,2 beta subunit [Frog virus 3]
MSEMSPKISVASMILLHVHLYVSSANMHPSNFVRHHIESFELTPAMARRTDATYHSAAVCDLTVTDPKGLETVYPRLELCKIPVMVGSAVCWTRTEGSPLPGECPSDPGGYFPAYTRTAMGGCASSGASTGRRGRRSWSRPRLTAGAS